VSRFFPIAARVPLLDVRLLLPRDAAVLPARVDIRRPVRDVAALRFERDFPEAERLLDLDFDRCLVAM